MLQDAQNRTIMFEDANPTFAGFFEEHTLRFRPLLRA